MQSNNFENIMTCQAWGTGGNMDYIHEERVHPPGVMILTGVVGCGLKLPVVFLEEHLKARKYLEILQTIFIPFLQG